MKEKFQYKFDEATGILYKIYYGPITIDDISSSWDYAIENNMIPERIKGFILDYTNANFDLDVKEYSKIQEYYKEHLDIFGGHRIAILTQSQKDVVIPKPSALFGRTAVNVEQSDIRPLVRAELKRLKEEIVIAIPKTSDSLSKYHLEDALERISLILDPNK